MERPAVDTTQGAKHSELSIQIEDPGVLASLGLNGQLFVFQLINFAIVAVIVWYLILKPLTKKMAERQKLIEESIDNAKEVETNLKMSEKKYQERIDKAKVDANALVEKAYTEAVALGDKIKEKASKDVELLVDQVKRNLAIEKEEMMNEIRKEAGALVVAAAEKFLEKKMDKESDKKIIEQALKGLKRSI